MHNFSRRGLLPWEPLLEQVAVAAGAAAVAASVLGAVAGADVVAALVVNRSIDRPSDTHPKPWLPQPCQLRIPF